MINLTTSEKEIEKELPTTVPTWIRKTLSKLTLKTRNKWIKKYKKFLKEYKTKSGKEENKFVFNFNTTLRETTENEIAINKLRLEINNLVKDLPYHSKNSIIRTAYKITKQAELKTLIEKLDKKLKPFKKNLFNKYGIKLDASFEEVRKQSEQLASDWEIRNPSYWTKTEAIDNIKDFSREQDPQYYRKKIRAELRLSNEIIHGILEREKIEYPSKWVSKTAKQRFKIERAIAIEYAKKTAFISNEGEIISAEKILNPINRDNNRYAEYTTRFKGIYNLAKKQGYESAGLITITVPPEYHRMLTVNNGRKSIPNKNWNGKLPNEINNLFNQAWKQARARWSYKNLSQHWLKATQPHQDGTPHWHITLIAKTEQQKNEMLKDLEETMLKNFKTEKVTEYKKRGIQFDEFKKENGEPEIAGALHYGLKALSYLLPTEGNEQDQRSKEEVESIAEWSKIWKIRRFSTSHGKSTLWKLLRRTEDTGHAAQIAAKAGDYANFIEQSEKIELIKRIKTNKYGEEYKEPTGWKTKNIYMEITTTWEKVWIEEGHSKLLINKELTVRHKNQGAAQNPALAQKQKQNPPVKAEKQHQTNQKQTEQTKDN